MRKVDAIELLDARAYISTENSDDPFCDSPAFSIYARDLFDFASGFCDPMQNRVLDQWTSPNGKKRTRTPRDTRIDIYQGESYNPDRYKSIMAEVLGNTTLYFRITDESSDGVEWSREYTYNGRFVVHWAMDEDDETG